MEMSESNWLPLTINGIELILEGVKSNSDATFNFDFEHDDESDVISLTNPTLNKSEVQNIPFYYFAYKFNDSVSSNIRSKFIHHLKFENPTEEKQRFITDAINRFCEEIPVQQFEYIIYPQSSSQLTKQLTLEISKVALPEFSIGTIEMVKSLPSNITFDYDRYEMYLRTATNPDGSPKYGNEKMVQSALDSAKSQMDRIHELDYFSIAKNIKGKYKNYLNKYYQFKTEKDAKIYKALTNGKVLIVDDIMTSGTTLLQLLKTLKTINPKLTPIVFTLIGK